ncbi:MAG: Gfo/Idh/MocA family oxidoreductase [Chloroflexi bacterium]|jgi:predicted dehydrogenase|nr:Gfo/Idh/MocA family oxidoreductase [Chloroflexota bacterium]
MEPKFGIIGCGGISRFHFHALAKCDARVVHIADVVPDAAQPYVQTFGARFSTDYRELLADPEVTVVSVLTNSKYHRDICLAALEAGKDVICEKTMTENADEAEQVARAALASNQLFFTAFMKRFFPAVQKAQELLPQLGRLFSAQVRAWQQWGNFYELDNIQGWEWVAQKYGGAVVKCAGSHMLDMTMHLLGRPASLYANVDYVPGTDFDRKATALLEYPNGMVVSFETATHPLKRIGYERNSWDEFIKISGVNGQLEVYTVQWDHPENNPALLVHYDNTTETVTEYRFAPVNPFDVEVQYFYDCLTRREQGRPNVVDGFNVDVVIEAIATSGSRRAPVELDWRGIAI